LDIDHSLTMRYFSLEIDNCDAWNSIIEDFLSILLYFFFEINRILLYFSGHGKFLLYY
jgi:hypothetical protein